jgi:predicted lipoprotein with Yx(FWY)xxD motif
MRRISILVAVTTVSTAIAASAVAHASGPTAHSGRAHTIKLAKTGKGKILVDGSGRTLYMFTRDHRNKSLCGTTCVSVWNRLTTRSNPTVGPGLKASLVGTIKLAHNVKQVTYAGHPLYIYTQLPTGTSYIGANEFGGLWYGVNVAGHAVK